GLSSVLWTATAKRVIKVATVPAIKRWPCSKRTPPFISGNKVPKERGQSGTARLEPVLVTKAPAKSRRKVQPAVTKAKRWSRGWKIIWEDLGSIMRASKK